MCDTDHKERTEDASAAQGTTTYARYTGYNALGQPAKLTLGNGVTTDYQYKPNNFRLHSIFTTHAATSQCFQSLSYNYDSVANVKDIIDYRGAVKFFV